MTPPNTTGAQALSDERFEAFFYGSFRDAGFTVGGHPVSRTNARHIWDAALDDREQAGAVAQPNAAPGDGQGAITDEQIDEIGKPFALHVMAPRGKESVREFARELLALAIPNRQTGPVIGWLYDWTHSSALGKPDERYTSFIESEEAARKAKGAENVRAVCLAAPGAAIAAREQEVSSVPALEPTITLGYVPDEHGTFRAAMTISGLPTEEKAQAALDHMEKLFCGKELEHRND